MFVLNAYFCRELRFVAILRSRLRFLLRNTGVDSDFTQNFWGKNWRLKALLYSTNYPMSVRFLKIPLQIVEDKGAKLRRKAVIIIIRDQVYVSSGLIICSKKHARSKNQFCNWEFRQCSVCSTIINLYKLQELGYKERVKISDFFCFDVKGCLDSLWLS